jgi:predicted MPP superfamily phosphohydrolase
MQARRRQARAYPVFSWLHLSDIHMGHGDAANRVDQQLVLQLLREDIGRQLDQGVVERPPDAVLLTGDVAFSAAQKDPQEYARASMWLRQLLSDLGLEIDRLFCVPGNHDVPRVPAENQNLARLVRELRSGSSIDNAIADPADALLVSSRMEHYMAFYEAFRPAATGHGRAQLGHWMHVLRGVAPFPVALVGLNSSLLAADNLDHGTLQVGKVQVTETLLQAQPSESLVIALTHHPHGWLSDGVTLRSLMLRRAHIHLHGHLHDPGIDQLISGASTELLTIAAGAVHGEAGNGYAGHGYSFGLVFLEDNGQTIARIQPRFLAKDFGFRPYVSILPDGALHVDHRLAFVSRGSRAKPSGSSADPRPSSFARPKAAALPLPHTPPLNFRGAGLERELRRRNPFQLIAPTAANYDYNDLPGLFCEPSGFRSLTNGGNHLILGSVGTGKTAILRALSVPVHSAEPDANGPAFRGLYLNSLQYARPLLDRWYDRTGSLDAAIHYFALSLARAAFEQLSEAKSPISCIRALSDRWGPVLGFPPFGDLDTSKEPTDGFIAHRMGTILQQINSLRPPDPIDYLGDQLSFHHVVQLLSTFGGWVRRSTQQRFMLLVDGYDQLGCTVRVVNSLLNQDYQKYFSVIAGCVHFGDLISQSCDGHVPQPDRDYRTDVVDDRYEDSSSLLSSIAERFMQREWQGVLSDRTLQRLNIADILGTASDRTIYAGHECVASLVNGNVRWYLKFLRYVFNHVEVSKGKVFVTRAHQHSAAKEAAQAIVNEDFASRGLREAVQLRTLTHELAASIKEYASQGTSIRTPIFLADVLGNGGDLDAVRPVIRRGVRHRFLVCDSGPRLMAEYSPTYVPEVIRLSGVFAPFESVPWM